MQKFSIGIRKSGKKIEDSANSLESMRDFVDETNRVFGENLKIMYKKLQDLMKLI